MGGPVGEHDPYAGEAALYDLTTAGVSTADVPFYTALAANAGGLLELGCGSGRVLLPCAEALRNSGGEVWGVDRSPAMLALARRQAAEQGLDAVRLVDGDLRSVRLGRSFPLVTIPFRTLFHLRTDDEWLAAMATVHAHLADGGRLAGDVFVPDPELLAAGERLSFTGEFEVPDGRVAVWDHWSVDVTAQIARRRRVAERLDPDGLVTERRHHLLVVFWRWPNEVLRLLEQGGFEVTDRFGGFDGEPFGAGAEDLVFVARPW
jgi:SAM-dependent methyltransferase